MSKITLTVKSRQRGGTGTITTEGGLSLIVEVKKLKGRQGYDVITEGVRKGIYELTAGKAWDWVIKCYNINNLELPENKTK